MGCNMDFSKWPQEILHEIEYLVFHNYNVFFGKKIFSRNSRFPVRSVFVINVSLFTSVVCYCQNGKGGNMENVRYATNDNTAGLIH
jgi:hypothetical protein